MGTDRVTDREAVQVLGIGQDLLTGLFRGLGEVLPHGPATDTLPDPVPARELVRLQHRRMHRPPERHRGRVRGRVLEEVLVAEGTDRDMF